MVERQRMPVIVGRGVDRASGLGAQQPSYPVYAANVYARDAKVAVRPGMAGTGFPPLAWGTDILKVYGVKATHDLLYVVYDRDSGELRIYRLDTANGVLQSLVTPAAGLWGTLNPLADFPVVSVDEAGGEVFFAHDEDTIDFRLPTVVYTPDYADPSQPGTLEELTAILTPDGVVAENVYFRGVFAYLEFLMGWGFGSSLEPDRGDIVRVSRPTTPRDFRTPNYLTCGSKKEPIIGAGVLGDPEEGGGVLIFGKEDSMYRVPGTNFDTFRPQLHDPDFGFVSSRVTRNVGRRLFTYASDGPREVVMGGSVSIAQPLELISPLPEELPLLGPTRMAFATFDKARKRLGFYFPEPITARVPVPGFLLSLWNPNDPRWTFDLIEQPILCEGYLLSTDTGTAPDPPVGYASDVSGDDVGLATDARYRSVRLAWTNNEQAGSETVQVFAKPAGGAWSSALLVPVSDLVEQVAIWDTALPLTAYEIAFRYLNGSVPAEGYEETDPDLWDAATAADSKGTVTTESAPVTALTASTFTAPGTPIAIAWTSAQQDAPYLLEKNVAGGGWVTVASELVATGYNYPIPPAELGLTVEFRVTPKRGAIAGTTSDVVSVLMEITVGATAFTSAVFTPTTRVAALAWSAAANAVNYLLEKSTNGGASWTTIGTIGGLTNNYAVPDAEINTTVRFRVRGQSGATQGAAATTDLAMTLVVGAGVLVVTTAFNPMTGRLVLSSSQPSNATTVRLEYNVGAGWVTVGTQGTGPGYTALWLLDVGIGGIPQSVLNTSTDFRVIGLNGAVSGAASNTVNSGFPLTIPGAPTGVTAVRNAPFGGVITVSWTGVAGDVSLYGVYFRKTVGFSYYGGTIPPGTTFQFGDEGQVECYVVSLICGGRIIAATSATVPVTGP